MAESSTTSGIQTRYRVEDPLTLPRPLLTTLGTTKSHPPLELDRPDVKAQPTLPALTRRSILLSLLLVALIAAFTPYNDYILQNTPFIGNHFPIGIITLIVGLVLIVNPFLQFTHRKPLGTGELIVILSMMLVAAAAPSSGLTRYFEPMIMGLIHHVTRFPWCQPLVNLLPTWLVPTRDSSSSLINTYFLGPDDAHASAVPWLRFLVPAVMGSVLIASIFGLGMYLAAIFRKQWVHHERLSYPLSTLPLELLAAPEAGRYYNKLWRNPILWAGASIPLFIYLMSGLHDYLPGVPYVSLTYDFSNAFTEHPWDHLPHFIQANRVYLSVVGLCFFVPSEVALSLWLFLVVNGVTRVLLTSSGVDTLEMEPVRGMGIYIGYFAAILWLARRHLWYVLTSAWSGSPREESEFTTYRSMLLGLLTCGTVAWGWMVLAGIQPVVAGLVLLLGVVLITLMSRVVAETGLFFLGATWQIPQFMSVLLGPKLVSMESFFLSSVVSKTFFGDLRETLMPFATTSLRLGSDVRSRERPQFFKWLFIAIALSTLVSGASHHYLSYTYGRSIMGDEHASNTVPVQTMTDAYAFAHGPQNASPARAWTHFGAGAAMVSVLMVGRTMFVSWPFHPIGLLLMNSWPLQVFWFSILIGWAIKTVMLHYGGAVVFKRARAFFIGLIVGEMLSAGIWMFIGLVTDGVVKYKLLPG